MRTAHRSEKNGTIERNDTAMNEDTLAAALAGPAPLSRPVRKCAYGRITEALAGNVAALLDQRVNDPAWADPVIAKLLAANGTPIGSKVLSDHRRNVCACKRYNDRETAGT